MSREIVRWSGAAAVLGGGIGILGGFLPQPFPGMYGLTGLLTLIGMVGVLLVLRSAGEGRWGWFGLGVAFVGNVFFAIERFEALAGVLYGAGLILLAVGAWRSGALPRWGSVAWVLAPLLGLPAYLVPEAAETLTLLATVAFGMGFVSAGYGMLRGVEAVRARRRT